MKIEDTELEIEKHYLDKVTYIPGHANGNTGHPNCEQGVIIRWNITYVKVLYCNSRTVQSTRPEDLVWDK